jgi:hypothetical protein
MAFLLIAWALVQNFDVIDQQSPDDDQGGSGGHEACSLDRMAKTAHAGDLRQNVSIRQAIWYPLNHGRPLFVVNRGPSSVTFLLMPGCVTPLPAPAPRST